MDGSGNTHTNNNAKEVRKGYTWFLSGNDKQDSHTHAGVAIVIRNDWIKYIVDVGPMNDRIMWMTLGYCMPIT